MAAYAAAPQVSYATPPGYAAHSHALAQQVSYSPASVYAGAPQVVPAAAPSHAAFSYAAAPQVSYAAPPVYASAPQMVPAAPAQQQAMVKHQIGPYLICHDAQGEFYNDSRTGESFDQPPVELLQLVQMQQHR